MWIWWKLPNQSENILDINQKGGTNYQKAYILANTTQLVKHSLNDVWNLLNIWILQIFFDQLLAITWSFHIKFVENYRNRFSFNPMPLFHKPHESSGVWRSS